MWQEQQSKREFFKTLIQTVNPVRAKILTFHTLSSPTQISKPVIDLIRQDYLPVEPKILHEFVSGKYLLQPQPFLLITLDDGRLEQLDNARLASEIVEKETRYKLPLIFFVMTKFDDLRLPVSEIPKETLSYPNTHDRSYISLGGLETIARSGLHQIHNHTRDHANLDLIRSEDERFANIVEGEKQIERIYKMLRIPLPQPRMFAYPYGAYEKNSSYISTLYPLAFSTRKVEAHYPWESHFLGRIGFS